MPSTYAHFIFGREVLKKQPAEIRELIRSHREPYLIGLHGPDIFFYYKALTTNPVNTMGYAMHDRPAAEFFRPAAEILRGMEGEKKAAALSYLLGFVCHFALDASCHGYIEKKIASSGISHTEIEVEFDRMLMVRDGMDPLRHCLTGHIRPRRRNAAVIAPFFPEVTEEQTLEALGSMVMYHRLLRAPGRAKRLLILGVLKMTGHYESMKGQLINLHTNPACVDSGLRLEKLLRGAVPRALELCGDFLRSVQEGRELSTWFSRTFGPGPGWEEIPVLSLEEELNYEV